MGTSVSGCSRENGKGFATSGEIDFLKHWKIGLKLYAKLDSTSDDVLFFSFANNPSSVFKNVDERSS